MSAFTVVYLATVLLTICMAFEIHSSATMQIELYTKCAMAFLSRLALCNSLSCMRSTLKWSKCPPLNECSHWFVDISDW